VGPLSPGGQPSRYPAPPALAHPTGSPPSRRFLCPTRRDPLARGRERLRREIEGEWALVLGGVLSAIFGLILAFLPSVGLLSLVWLIGIYAILFGIALIVLAFRVRGCGDGETAGWREVRQRGYPGMCRDSGRSHSATTGPRLTRARTTRGRWTGRGRPGS
jgi:Short repeat of unknown function (DUF308)